MQSSSNELSTLVPDNAKCKLTEVNTKCIIIPELIYVTEMAERLDTMFSVNLNGFQTQLEASCVSSHTEEL